MNPTSLPLRYTDLPAPLASGHPPLTGSSLLSFAPLLPSSLSLPRCVLFHLFFIESAFSPQQNYHLTLMRFLIIYTEAKGLKPAR